MGIVQGDNGVNYPFIIPKDINLTGATVKVTIKRNGVLVEKTATVTNADKGECYFTLLDTDTTTTGVYEYQWLVEYDDGLKKYGLAKEFYVSEKLAVGTPEVVIVDGGTF